MANVVRRAAAMPEKALAEASIVDTARSISDDDELARLGYKSEFKREFTNLGTISFAFSIMCGRPEEAY